MAHGMGCARDLGQCFGHVLAPQLGAGQATCQLAHLQQPQLSGSRVSILGGVQAVSRFENGAREGQTVAVGGKLCRLCWAAWGSSAAAGCLSASGAQ